jgi:hypothetical protein
LPKYLFTGAFPRVLTGLRQGVNAHRDGTPDGATIEANHGDEVTTTEPYEHPELQLEDENATLPEPAPALSPGGVIPGPPVEVQLTPGEVVLTAEEASHLSPELLAQIQAAAHPDEPAHTDMTAEGAPAPETH